MTDTRGERTLRLLSRLLPREFRARVFVPALSDLHLDEAEGKSGRWARLGFAIACLRIGLPQYLWRRRRPTRFAMAMGVAAVVVVVVLARLHATPWPPETVRAAKP
jgi:hypothetical protein